MLMGFRQSLENVALANRLGFTLVAKQRPIAEVGDLCQVGGVFWGH